VSVVKDYDHGLCVEELDPGDEDGAKVGFVETSEHEIPIYSVIGFGEVEECGVGVLCGVGDMGLDGLEEVDVVVDPPARDKGFLHVVNDVAEDVGHTVSESFGEDFEFDWHQGDGAIIGGVSTVAVFVQEGDCSFSVSAKECAPGELVVENPLEYGSESLWGELEKFGGEAVESWGFVRGHGFNGRDEFRYFDVGFERFSMLVGDFTCEEINEAGALSGCRSWSVVVSKDTFPVVNKDALDFYGVGGGTIDGTYSFAYGDLIKLFVGGSKEGRGGLFLVVVVLIEL
jgi:hypothetical protein